MTINDCRHEKLGGAVQKVQNKERQESKLHCRQANFGSCTFVLDFCLELAMSTRSFGCLDSSTPTSDFVHLGWLEKQIKFIDRFPINRI